MSTNPEDPLDELIETLRTDALPSEIARRHADLEAMAHAFVPSILTRPRMIRKVLTAKVLAAAAVTTVLAGGAAAATGSLPDPVQRVVAAVTPFEAPHHRDEARPSVAPPTDSTSDVSVPDLPVEDSVELSVPGNPPTSHESDDQAVEPTRSGDDASDEAHDPAGSADAPESDEPDRPAADAPLPGQPPAPPTTESHEDSSGHESGDHVAPPAKFDPSHPKEAPGSSIPHS